MEWTVTGETHQCVTFAIAPQFLASLGELQRQSASLLLPGCISGDTASLVPLGKARFLFKSIPTWL